VSLLLPSAVKGKIRMVTLKQNRPPILGMKVFVFVAALYSCAAYGQTITFTFKLTCDNGAPDCPNSGLVIARQVGQVSSDTVEIASVNSDQPGLHPACSY
jgi:hypothetical protein